VTFFGTQHSSCINTYTDIASDQYTLPVTNLRKMLTFSLQPNYNCNLPHFSSVNINWLCNTICKTYNTVN